MKLKLIACKVLTRELSYLAALSKNYVDITFIRRDYHDIPEKLNNLLQREIDKIDCGEDDYSQKEADFDAILLGYGLCSNAICGLTSKKYSLVVPKAHDCITLFLGSKEKYLHEFQSRKGIYWYNKGWIENSLMPSEERFRLIHQEYVTQYGEENADFLLEQEKNWLGGYEYGIFIKQNIYQDRKERKQAKRWIKDLGWNYEELEGDVSLLRDFIEGNWDENKFVVVPPNKKINASFDEEILMF